ncbi:MAG TPA: hypothetical protein VMI53_05435 [Opitutaceae bacterium]|nr:hypothetical protein [Opitutaceae bacterium]
MNSIPLHPRLTLPAALAAGLLTVAALAARKTARGAVSHQFQRRGFTLRPGPDTPIWNELVRQAGPLLRKRGSKAHLARILGVPRQRLQDCLKARVACLDGERTLLLLCWVAARQQGRELTA